MNLSIDATLGNQIPAVKTEIRTITYQKRLYFERQDLLEYLREFAGSEETDVRRRMEELIENLNGPHGEDPH